MFVFLLMVTNETSIDLERPFYLLTKTWKDGGGVFGTKVAG